jgi:hypothetical protein
VLLNLAVITRMKRVFSFKNVDINIQGILVAAFFVWNLVEGAVFENVYPLALVKLYKYPVWRLSILFLIYLAAEWCPCLALMIAFTLFFYIMDIEVTRERWSVSELKRKSK